MTCSFRFLDYGVDATLHLIRQRAGILYESALRVDVQIKSTTNPLFVGDQLKYDLDVRNYHSLRHSDPNGPPRLLLVLVLPDSEKDWLSVSEDSLVLRRCMYWSSFEGAKSTTNRRSVRVWIPRKNVFSSEFLTNWVNRYESEDFS